MSRVTIEMIAAAIDVLPKTSVGAIRAAIEAAEAVREPDLLPGLLRAVAIAQTVPGYETSEIYDRIFGAAVKAGEGR